MCASGVCDFSNGSDIPLEGSGRPNAGCGHEQKLHMTDLEELSKRSGPSLSSLQDALGTLNSYRLKDGPLKCSTFFRSTSSFEFLTDVPSSGIV